MWQYEVVEDGVERTVAHAQEKIEAQADGAAKAGHAARDLRATWGKGQEEQGTKGRGHEGVRSHGIAQGRVPLHAGEQTPHAPGRR